MSRHVMVLPFVCGVSLVLSVALTHDLKAADKSSQTFKKPIRNPKFDPQAEQVEIFDAMDTGLVTVKLIPKNALGGTLLNENKTDTPLTVKIPDAVAAVSIHSQLGNQGLMGLGNPGGGNNQAGGQQALGGGIGQPQGNGLPGIGGQNGQIGAPNGQGFFSIPAEKVISLPFNSVCLEHGKPEPGGNSRYTLVPITRISRDPVLRQLLTVVATGKVDQKATQAAAWHLANKLSFQTLSEKTTLHLGTLTPIPDFSREQIQEAEKLVDEARHKAADAEVTKAEQIQPEPVAEAGKSIRLATK